MIARPRSRLPGLVLVALLPGAAAPRATAQVAGDPAAATAAAPLVAGRVIPADSGGVASLRVTVDDGRGAPLYAPVDPAGGFALALDGVPVRDTVEILIDAAPGAARRYLPALARVARVDLGEEQRFVLVPVRWTLAAGTHAGATVDVSARRALLPACDGCSSFFHPVVQGGDPAGPPRGVLSWPADELPLRVAFDRAYSTDPITPRDSAAFWRVADAINAAFGTPVFRPAPYGETLPDEVGGPSDVVFVRIDRTLPYAGLGVVIAEREQVVLASLRLQRAALLHAPDAARLVAHELMHTLAVGHTCAWTSVVADARHCPARRATGATAEDVAYVLLLLRVGALERSAAAQWGIGAALAGEARLAP